MFLIFIYFYFRFGAKHVTENGLNVVNEAKLEEWKSNINLHTVNSIKNDVQIQLRKRTYDFTRANVVLDQWNKECVKSKEAKDNNVADKSEETKSECQGEDTSRIVDEDCCNQGKNGSSENNVNCKVEAEAEDCTSETRIGPVSDDDLIKLRCSEKKKV